MTLITFLRLLILALCIIKNVKTMITTRIEPPIAKYIGATGDIVRVPLDDIAGIIVGVSVGAVVGVSVGNTVGVTVGDVVGTLEHMVFWYVEHGVLMYQPTGQLLHGDKAVFRYFEQLV